MTIQFDGDFSMTIGGLSVESEARIAVLNPANEEVVGYAPDISRLQFDDAVAAARAAFLVWRQTPLNERRKAVECFASIIAEHSDELSHLFTLEQGRPLDKARTEVDTSAFWASAIAAQEIPVRLLEDNETNRTEIRHIPIGVVGAIVPWNFPLMLGIWKISAALLTGNTIIVKPSPFTPLCMLKLGELMRDKLPKGVFNVISGSDQVGPWMTEHPGIDKISFTGSSATGRHVMSSASGNLKRLTLELGGNDAAIVLSDVDVDAVAEQLFWGAFGNTGQVCVAIKRLYVHADVYDAVARALVGIAQRVKVGDGLEQGSDIGPVQNKLQFERLKQIIDNAKSQGLAFLTGGKVPEGKGYFLPVSIVDNPPEDSEIVATEQFGPILPMLKFHNVNDVIFRANNSAYGLGASIWTRDEALGLEIASQIEAGMVGVNQPPSAGPDRPFNGVKQSGLGAENGEDGLLSYTNLQTISLRKAAQG